MVWSYLSGSHSSTTCRHANSLSYLEPSLKFLEEEDTVFAFVADKALSDLILASLTDNIDSIVAKFVDVPDTIVL